MELINNLIFGFGVARQTAGVVASTLAIRVLDDGEASNYDRDSISRHMAIPA